MESSVLTENTLQKFFGFVSSSLRSFFMGQRFISSREAKPHKSSGVCNESTQ